MAGRGEKKRSGSMASVKKNWMLLGVVASIPLARWAPWIGAKGGPLRPEVTVKYGAVGIIFFLSGMSLQPKQLVSAASNGRFHCFIQGFTLAFVPVAVRVLVVPWAGLVLSRQLLDGVVAVSCMPPPVSSAVILTKAVGGNEAAAIFNSALGSLLGVVVTPVLLVASIAHEEGPTTLAHTTEATSTVVVLANVLRQLASTVVMPLALGQAVRPQFERIIERRKPQVAVIGQATLLLIIYTTFCDSFSAPSSEESSPHMATTLVGLVILVVSVQVALMALVFFLATKSSFPPEDVVAAVFCATHKSLTLGVPVLRLVFADHPNLPLLTVPLLIYHPTQILLGGLVCPALKNWLRRRQQHIPVLLDDAIPSVLTSEKSAAKSSSTDLTAVTDDSDAVVFSASDGAVTRRTRLVVGPLSHSGVESDIISLETTLIKPNGSPSISRDGKNPTTPTVSDRMGPPPSSSAAAAAETTFFSERMPRLRNPPLSIDDDNAFSSPVPQLVAV